MKRTTGRESKGRALGGDKEERREEAQGAMEGKEVRPKETTRGHSSASRGGNKGRRGKLKGTVWREPGQQTLQRWLGKGTGSTPGHILGARVAGKSTQGGGRHQGKCQGGLGEQGQTEGREDQLTGPMEGQEDKGGPVQAKHYSQQDSI